MNLMLTTQAEPLTLIRLKALAHDLRYEIVCLLAQRELCVCELEVLLEGGQSKVSYHLNILKEAGIVGVEQRGKNSFYRLERQALYALGGELLKDVLHRFDALELTHQDNSMCYDKSRDANSNPLYPQQRP